MSLDLAHLASSAGQALLVLGVALAPSAWLVLDALSRWRREDEDRVRRGLSPLSARNYDLLLKKGADHA